MIYFRCKCMCIGYFGSMLLFWFSTPCVWDFGCSDCFTLRVISIFLHFFFLLPYPLFLIYFRLLFFLCVTTLYVKMPILLLPDVSMLACTFRSSSFFNFLLELYRVRYVYLFFFFFSFAYFISVSVVIILLHFFFSCKVCIFHFYCLNTAFRLT